MKKGLIILSAAVLVLASCGQKQEQIAQAKNQPTYSPKVTELLSQMSVEEKVGQMTQINLDVIMKGAIYNLEEPHTVDTAKLKEAISKYKVGSILNCGGHGYPLEQWHQIINAIQEVAAQNGDHKVPVLYGIDAIHGANYSFGSILFPQQLAQAATFNPALVKRGAEITAYEVRAAGIPWNFSPVLDLGRQPLWSRFFETYGEDVYLAQQMANAAITGYEQGDVSKSTAVASCMKHFLGYSFSFSGKDRTPVYMGERHLREYYLPTFKTAVDAGAKTVMINSGELNGIPVHADEFVLKTLLRDELGFEGLAVTDWEDIMKLYNIHHVAKDNREAVKMAINAGIDMSMVPNDYAFTEDLIDLVNAGEVPMSRIDEAVSRILQLKVDLGLFENASAPTLEDYPLFGGEEHYKAAYKAAIESVTLLENKGALPLSTSEKILLTGPGADDLIIQNGAWSRTWQGIDTFIVKEKHLTVLGAMNRLSSNIAYEKGTSIDSIENISAAVAKAKASSKIVVVLGEKPSTEKVGDIDDLTLDQAQIDLVKALSKTGKPIVAVMMFNRPRIVSEIVGLCDAVLMAYQPGSAGGEAIADLLFGNQNPSGKLPFTYPRFVNTHVTYDHKATEELDAKFGMNAFNPQWTFGSGLSYSTFEYSNLTVSDTVFSGSGTMEVTVTVTNTGKMKGKESVLCFVKDHTASITPEVKRLRAFDKIELEAGETKTVSFKLSADDLAFVNRDMTWITEPGKFTVSIAGLAKEFSYQ